MAALCRMMTQHHALSGMNNAILVPRCQIELPSKDKIAGCTIEPWNNGKDGLSQGL